MQASQKVVGVCQLLALDYCSHIIVRFLFGILEVFDGYAEIVGESSETHTHFAHILQLTRKRFCRVLLNSLEDRFGFT